MYSIEVTIPFEYAHRLLKHQGKCRNLHGHSGKAILRFSSGTLDSNGFVVDFGEVKSVVKRWIDDNWDHAYLFAKGDPIGRLVEESDLKHHVFDRDPTAEVMAETLFAFASTALPISPAEVTIQETETGRACYAL